MEAFAVNLKLDELADQFSIFAGMQIWVAFGEICIDTSPYEQERVLVLQAVASRKLEFYSGRHYAREALQQAGYMPDSILRGKKGNPLWPKGALGSITHDLQQVIVVVVRETNIKGIGIDLIMNPAIVESHLQSLIASEIELKALTLVSSSISPLALAFSLKEAVVKAVSPRIDYYLNLLDIHLTVECGYLMAKLPHIKATLSCNFFKLKEGFVTLAVLR